MNISHLCIKPDSLIRDAIICIDRDEAKIALVVDEERRLVDTITDGDVRRALLNGVDLDEPVRVLKPRKAGSPYPKPVTANKDTDPAELICLMEEHLIRQVPLLDDEQRVVGLTTLSGLLESESLPLQAVVMAGGFGKRLRPLTDEIPKTMLTVGDKPLLESILKQLRESGITRVNLTTYYKADVIAQHFGDGQRFGVELNYVKEEQPLGTAGALSLLESPNEPLLVINGDILTGVDFRSMLDFHTENKADMTVAVRLHEYQVPYGVVESDDISITSILEKPIFRKFVNAGIYLLNSEVCRFIPNGQSYDMTDLIDRLIAEGRRVISFPIREYWLDIGKHEDYKKAQKEYKEVF